LPGRPARAVRQEFETALVSASLKVARQALDAVLDATATTGRARSRIAAQDRWLICRARERDDAEQRPYRRAVRCSDAAVPEPPARGDEPLNRKKPSKGPDLNA